MKLQTTKKTIPNNSVPTMHQNYQFRCVNFTEIPAKRDGFVSKNYDAGCVVRMYTRG